MERNILGLLRYLIAVTILAGAAPNYFLIWIVWRGISIFLPSQHIYQIGDDFLYSMYQRTVVFFFEHCTGQKVTTVLISHQYLHSNSLLILVFIGLCFWRCRTNFQKERKCTLFRKPSVDRYSILKRKLQPSTFIFIFILNLYQKR